MLLFYRNSCQRNRWHQSSWKPSDFFMYSKFFKISLNNSWRSQISIRIQELICAKILWSKTLELSKNEVNEQYEKRLRHLYRKGRHGVFWYRPVTKSGILCFWPGREGKSPDWFFEERSEDLKTMRFIFTVHISNEKFCCVLMVKTAKSQTVFPFSSNQAIFSLILWWWDENRDTLLRFCRLYSFHFFLKQWYFVTIIFLTNCGKNCSSARKMKSWIPYFRE